MINKINNNIIYIIFLFGKYLFDIIIFRLDDRNYKKGVNIIFTVLYYNFLKYSNLIRYIYKFYIIIYNIYVYVYVFKKKFYLILLVIINNTI